MEWRAETYNGDERDVLIMARAFSFFLLDWFFHIGYDTFHSCMCMYLFLLFGGGILFSVLFLHLPFLFFLGLVCGLPHTPICFGVVHFSFLFFSLSF